MRKNIIVIFLFMSMFSLSFQYCHAETTELLIEDSPYYIHQDLIIKEGEIFTAEPGVVIGIAKDVSIIVEGRIDISGYPRGGEVIFKAQGPRENYHKGFWKGIIINSKEKNSVNYVIIQHSKTAVEIKPGAFIDITDSVITQNKAGIKADTVNDLSIIRNTFLGNFTDIELADSAGCITGNFFQGSLIGIKLSEAYPKIENNYFKQAHKKAIECDNKRNFNIAENWWGCADREKIKGLISQKGEGLINFEPFLEKAPDLKE